MDGGDVSKETRLTRMAIDGLHRPAPALLSGPRGTLHNTTIHASRCSSFSDFCSRIGVVVFPFEMATWHAWQSMKAAGKGDADELAG
jgi:hypothetical protein